MTSASFIAEAPGLSRSLIAVGLGGAVGANARYLLGREVSERWPSAFPWGTLLVNASGCLVLGLFIGWLASRDDRPLMRLFVATGMLGAYTTFSAFTYEAVRLVDDGRPATASAYVIMSLALCLGCAFAGMRIGDRSPTEGIDGSR